MLFDRQLLFYHTGTAYSFTSGEYVTLAGITASGQSASATIDMGVAQDMGIGNGAELPQLGLYVGTAITASDTALTVNFQFRGSTDSTHWTVYAETGALTTASYTAGAVVLPIPVPRRPFGAALPRYYDINAVVSAATASISTGTIIGGIVLARGDTDTFGQYPAGFSVS